MAEIIITVRVRGEDGSAVLELAAGLGVPARVLGDGEAETILVMVESFVLDDGAQEAEEDLLQRLRESLQRQGVQFDMLGLGIDHPSLTASLFTVRRIGVDYDEDPLVVRANSRAEFDERLHTLRTMFPGDPLPPVDLAGCEVTVEGLAAGDADVQEPPFLPRC